MKQKDIDRCQHINLSTTPKDIVKTMMLEIPIVEYFFRKEYGGKNKYQKHEDHLLDKALAEQQSQVTDISEWISHKGNRWMSYTYVEYFPKAKYAYAWPTSFIYYETYGSCGAFFPLFRLPEKGKKEKKTDRIYGAIIFTSHFFLQMSERTGKAYRSSELIQEFITTRNAHAMQMDDDGEMVTRFVGGYGFGKWWEEDGIRVCQVRTYLNENGRDSLNRRQKKLVEKLNAAAVLFEDGMYNPDVALDTALAASLVGNQDVLVTLRDKISSETLQQICSNPITKTEYQQAMIKRMKAIKTLGMEREMQFSMMLTMGYVGTLEKMLHLKLNEPQLAIVASYVSMESDDMVRKYARRDMSKATAAEQQEFMDDFIKMSARVSRRMKLRSMTEDCIRQFVGDILADSMTKEN